MKTKQRAENTHPKKKAAVGVGSGHMVSLPGGMQLLRVSDAEFETAKRILARWMFEHPEIESLVLRRQDGRQANTKLTDASNKRPSPER